MTARSLTKVVALLLLLVSLIALWLRVYGFSYVARKEHGGTSGYIITLDSLLSVEIAIILQTKKQYYFVEKNSLVCRENGYINSNVSLNWNKLLIDGCFVPASILRSYRVSPRLIAVPSGKSIIGVTVNGNIMEDGRSKSNILIQVRKYRRTVYYLVMVVGSYIAIPLLVIGLLLTIAYRIIGLLFSEKSGR